MNLRFFVLSALFICNIQSLTAQDFSIQEVFPQTQYISLKADPLEHRMMVSSIELSKRVLASFGAEIPVFDIVLFSQPIQLGFGASTHIELEPDERANLVTADFYVDYAVATIPVSERHRLQLSTGHSSDHFSDNWYEFQKLSKSLIYSRDYVKAYGIYGEPNELMVYAGAIYSYFFIINRETYRPWTFHCGVEKKFAPIQYGIVPVVALDIKIRQEVSYASTQNLHIGLEFSKGNRNYRLAYQLRNGVDQRGQYYIQRRSFHSIGFFFEL